MIPWRRTQRELTIWYHPAFRLPIPSSVLSGMDTRRADSVLTWLLDRRLVADARVREAPEIAMDDLRRVHTDAWLLQLDDPAVIAGLMGLSVGQVPVASIVELWRRGVGATVEAARHAARGDGLAATLMGGFHHAGPERGSGFCAINDIAVAIACLRADGFAGRIAVIDLDAHPPDGIAAFVLPNVDLRSVSVASAWEAGPGVRDERVPLGATDDVYLAAVDRLLRDLGRPALAFYIAGSDPLDGDPLGALGVSEAGLRERDRRVFDALGATPTVVVPGGGYLPTSWRALAGSIAQAAGSQQTVADGYDPVARRVGRVARTFAPFEVDGPLITEADLGMAFGGAREQRFLGYYTRHGIELALTRYGMFDALRRMGFADLEVELDCASNPQRLRVLGSFGALRCCLVDLKLTFRQVGAWRTLFIEWLELRDPRPSTAARRPTLPGQQAGGLGLARDVGSILRVTVERLHLSGISFVPSHYHIAWMVRDQAVFVDPTLQGRFLALIEHLDGVPLAAASARLSGDGLPTEDGDAIGWTPGLMVHATNPELREHLEVGAAEARRVKRGTLLRLLPAHVTFGR